VIAALITIPLPAAFSKYLPALLAASLAFVILQAVLLCGLYTWRSLHQYAADADADDTDTLSPPPKLYRTKPLAVASGVATALQYLVLLWFVFMLALSMLWMGGGLVAANATMDGAATMAVVDETMPRLIQNAMGIDPRKQVGVGRAALLSMRCRLLSLEHTPYSRASSVVVLMAEHSTASMHCFTAAAVLYPRYQTDTPRAADVLTNVLTCRNLFLSPCTPCAAMCRATWCM
jgi:hypothetical protein